MHLTSSTEGQQGWIMEVTQTNSSTKYKAENQSEAGIII